MKFEYLQVYLNKAEDGTLRYLAFDGNSVCDGDENLITLLNKLGRDRWSYCAYVTNDANIVPCHILKREVHWV